MEEENVEKRTEDLGREILKALVEGCFDPFPLPEKQLQTTIRIT